MSNLSNFAIKTLKLASTDPRWDRVAIVSIWTGKVKWEGSRDQANRMMKYFIK